MSRQDRTRINWELFVTDVSPTTRLRRILRYLPSSPRCRICNVPFAGFGGSLMRMLQWQRSSQHPDICNMCQTRVLESGSGVEAPLTLLFADARDSTGIAETMSPTEFRNLMNRFLTRASEVLVRHDALIDKFVGDEVIAVFIPGFAGPDYTSRAFEAAVEVLKETSEIVGAGIGIHHGPTYFGAMGSESTNRALTIMGDSVNTTARLVGEASEGEIIISDDAAALCQDSIVRGLARRSLSLKGKKDGVNVRVWSLP